MWKDLPWSPMKRVPLDMGIQMQERRSVPAPSSKRKEIEQAREFTYRKRKLDTYNSADNGKEFAKHQEIAKELEISFYFCNPYHFWERGANENTNELIRQ